MPSRTSICSSKSLNLACESSKSPAAPPLLLACAAGVRACRVTYVWAGPPQGAEGPCRAPLREIWRERHSGDYGTATPCGGGALLATTVRPHRVATPCGRTVVARMSLSPYLSQNDQRDGSLSQRESLSLYARKTIRICVHSNDAETR